MATKIIKSKKHTQIKQTKTKKQRKNMFFYITIISEDTINGVVID